MWVMPTAQKVTLVLLALLSCTAAVLIVRRVRLRRGEDAGRIDGPRRPTPESKEVSSLPLMELRQLVLGPATDEWPDPESADGVRVVLMEAAIGQNTVSVVCHGDGSTSLYFSTGGGIIGAGEHARVRAAADVFRRRALQAPLRPATEAALPGPGRIAFHLRVGSELRTGEASEGDLVGGRHELSSLFQAGNAVITAIREAHQ
jgi:hypothetical protein